MELESVAAIAPNNDIRTCPLHAMIPGEAIHEKQYCHWGPSGFVIQILWKENQLRFNNRKERKWHNILVCKSQTFTKWPLILNVFYSKMSICLGKRWKKESSITVKVVNVKRWAMPKGGVEDRGQRGSSSWLVITFTSNTRQWFAILPINVIV